LALPNLADVLTYHVIAGLAPSTSLSNGLLVQPISSSNTLKITVTSTGSVFVNQAQVTLADVSAYNGLVHVINEVVLPVETVVDLAIDNGFSTLTTAVIQEELVPVLSNPLASFTVFAPTNEAFDNLATTLGTDINGILALPNLTDVLTYHVLGSEVLSTELTAGPVNTVNGAAVTVSLTNGVMINNANVTLADVLAYNGVVHVIDAVLLPIDTQVDQFSNEQLTLYPNPVQDVLTINGEVLNYSIMDQQGRLVQKGGLMSNKTIDFGGMESGIYFLQLQSASGMSNHKVVKN
jgi:transforming growth factor-beta-induced protein